MKDKKQIWQAVKFTLFSVSAGEFVLIPPGTLHRTGGAYCVRTLVHFTDDFLRKTYTASAMDNLLRCFAHVKIVPLPDQLDACKFLLKKLSQAENETEFALSLGQLLQTLEKCGDQEIQYDQVGKMIAYINQNYAAIRNIEQIADQFYISKYHLCRVFKKAMQVTIIEYLNQVRLKNARRLLEASDKEIGAVSELCGYNSVAYFSNIFKRSFGYSPSEYRKRIRAQSQ